MNAIEIRGLSKSFRGMYAVDHLNMTVPLKAKDMSRTKLMLGSKFSRVEEEEAGYIRVCDDVKTEIVVKYLYDNGIVVTEVGTDKIGLEEHYIDLMNGGKSQWNVK